MSILLKNTYDCNSKSLVLSSLGCGSASSGKGIRPWTFEKNIEILGHCGCLWGPGFTIAGVTITIKIILILTNQSVYICDNLDIVEYFLLYFLSFFSTYFILKVFINLGSLKKFGVKEQAHNSKINNTKQSRHRLILMIWPEKWCCEGGGVPLQWADPFVLSTVSAMMRQSI